MFGLFKKKSQQGEVVEIKIDGMHCTSCSLNIDDALEETEGVISANTSYAKSIAKVIFDEKVISTDKIISVIKSTGYEAFIN